jgi:hypothetical protein
MNSAIELFIDDLNIDRNKLNGCDLITSLMRILHIKSSREKFISFVYATYGEGEIRHHYSKSNTRTMPIDFISKMNNPSKIGRTWFNLKQLQFIKVISSCLQDKIFIKNTLIIETTFSDDKQKIDKMKIIDHCNMQTSFGAFYLNELEELIQIKTDAYKILNSAQFACQKGGEIWVV